MHIFHAHIYHKPKRVRVDVAQNKLCVLPQESGKEESYVLPRAFAFLKPEYAILQERCYMHMRQCRVYFKPDIYRPHGKIKSMRQLRDNAILHRIELVPRYLHLHTMAFNFTPVHHALNQARIHIFKTDHDLHHTPTLYEVQRYRHEYDAYFKVLSSYYTSSGTLATIRNLLAMLDSKKGRNLSTLHRISVLDAICYMRFPTRLSEL